MFDSSSVCLEVHLYRQNTWRKLHVVNEALITLRFGSVEELFDDDN